MSRALLNLCILEVELLLDVLLTVLDNDALIRSIYLLASEVVDSAV